MIVGSNEYTRIHQRLACKYGKAPACIWGQHESKWYEWANVTGNYTVSLEDYLPMCISCHRKWDVTPESRLKIKRSMEGARRAIKGRIYQYTPEMSLIAVHECMNDAAAAVGLSRTAINAHVKGQTKTTGGYIWVLEPKYRDRNTKVATQVALG